MSTNFHDKFQNFYDVTTAKISKSKWGCISPTPPNGGKFGTFFWERVSQQKVYNKSKFFVLHHYWLPGIFIIVGHNNFITNLNYTILLKTQK